MIICADGKLLPYRWEPDQEIEYLRLHPDCLNLISSELKKAGLDFEIEVNGQRSRFKITCHIAEQQK